MPGILPMKVIKVGNNSSSRIAQACDRCRSKKIRCDGFRPCCSQCVNVGFECKTSDKLSRRAFPRGYTESLEDRVRALETEIRELKDLLDSKDEKIDVLSRIRSSDSRSRRGSDESAVDATAAKAAVRPQTTSSFTVHQSSTLQPGPGHDPFFIGSSSSRSVADALKRRIHEAGRPCPPFNTPQMFDLGPPSRARPPPINEAWKPPPRLVTDQMVNIFFQEWAPLFPVLHRPSFLSLYEAYVASPERIPGKAAQVQLNLVFGIAALSNKSRINYDTTIIEAHWLNVLDTFIKQNTLPNLQCFILAQIFCLQTGDYARLNYYKSQSVGMALRLGLHQSQRRFCLSTLLCETRKKIFWTLYCLDCFSAAALGLPTSLNDGDIHCEYPVDVDDEYISEQGIQPALPGESTKLSSALQLFKGIRILSRVLKRLYPASTTHQLSMADITAFNEELDQWLGKLPSHLRMEFANDKPATHTISSRSPLVSLTYHYIRSLIHRPAACSADNDEASSSLLVLASSSKHIIQILQLLEERNLSFSMCFNKNELMALCGCSLLLQTLSLDKSSALLKDYQRVTCTVIEMLRRQNAPGEAEFRRVACSLISVRRESTASQVPRLLSLSPSQSSVEFSGTPSGSRELRESATGEESAPRTRSKSSMVSASAPQQTTRRFRLIAPSAPRKASVDESVKSSPKTPALSDASSVKSARSSMSTSKSNLNLDFFTFPPCPDKRSRAQPVQSPQGDSPGWDHLFDSIASETQQMEDSPREETDWPSITDLLPPLQEPTTKTASSAASADQWVMDAAVGATDLAETTAATKPKSLLSFSGESATSAEDLGQYDWISSERDGGFIAADVPSAITTDEPSPMQEEIKPAA